MGAAATNAKAALPTCTDRRGCVSCDRLGNGRRGPARRPRRRGTPRTPDSQGRPPPPPQVQPEDARQLHVAQTHATGFGDEEDRVHSEEDDSAHPGTQQGCPISLSPARQPEEAGGHAVGGQDDDVREPVDVEVDHGERHGDRGEVEVGGKRPREPHHEHGPGEQHARHQLDERVPGTDRRRAVSAPAPEEHPGDDRDVVATPDATTTARTGAGRRDHRGPLGNSMDHHVEEGPDEDPNRPTSRTSTTNISRSPCTGGSVRPRWSCRSCWSSGSGSGAVRRTGTVGRTRSPCRSRRSPALRRRGRAG